MQLKNNQGTQVGINVDNELVGDITNICTVNMFEPINHTTLTNILNNTSIESDDIVSPIDKPVINPIEKDSFIVSSDFVTNNGIVTNHISTLWVFGTTETDVINNVSPIVSSDTYLTSYPHSLLNPNTEYFVKVKYVSDIFTSDWSDVVKITTVSQYINQPTISIDSTIDTSLFPTLTLSDFITTGYTDTVKEAILDISTDSLFTSYTRYNVNGQTFKFNVALLTGTTYYVRFKYVGNLKESVFSDTLVFTTVLRTPKPILSGVSIGNEYETVTITIDDFSIENLYKVAVTGGEAILIKNKISWRLPVIESDISTYNEKHKLYVTAISNKGSLEQSMVAEHMIVVNNLSLVNDTNLTIGVTNVSIENNGLTHNIRPTIITQEVGESDFVSLNNIVITEKPINILNQVTYDITTPSKLRYNPAYYTPKVGDKLLSDGNKIYTVTFVDDYIKVIKIDNDFNFPIYKLYTLPSITVNDINGNIASASYSDGLLKTLYSEIMFTNSRVLDINITNINKNEFIGLTSGVNKVG